MKKKIYFILIFILFFIIFLFNSKEVKAVAFNEIPEYRVIEDFKSCIIDLNDENYTQNYVILWHEQSNSLCVFFLNDNDLSVGHYNKEIHCWKGSAKMYQFYNYNIDSSNRELYILGDINNYGGGIPVFSTFSIDIGNNTTFPITPIILGFHVTYDTTPKLNPPLTIYTNYFAFEDALIYECFFSSDSINWEEMNYRTMNYVGGAVNFNFYCTVNKNGDYFFKLVNKETLEESYCSACVTNLKSEFEIKTGIEPTITFVPNTSTDKPIVAWSSEFLLSSDTIVFFSEDKKDWKSMNTASQDLEGRATYGSQRYWTRIFKNGTYFFKFVLIEKDENGNYYTPAKTVEEIIEKKVDFITVEDYMSDDYIFKPVISLDFNEESQSFIIRTQSILLDKALNLNCFYNTYEEGLQYPNEDVTSWNKMEINFENNYFMESSEAYFYIEIPIINASDTNYKIAFYNYVSGKSSEIIYYNFVYGTARDYVENDLKVHLGVSVKLNDFIKNVESKFGILGLPISLVRNFSNKIITLQAKEPILHIPELYDPIYNNKIYNGFDFNFNSLLVSDSVVFIHNFYLSIVDIFLIYLFLRFCIKTLKSFIDKESDW